MSDPLETRTESERKSMRPTRRNSLLIFLLVTTVAVCATLKSISTIDISSDFRCRTRWRTGSGIGKSCGKSAGRLAAPATILRDRAPAVGFVEEAPGGGSGQKRAPEFPRVGGAAGTRPRAITTHRFGLWAVDASSGTWLV